MGKNPKKVFMKKKNTQLLGAHMSIAGGIENAYGRGASIGCTAIQFFTHSNRQWAMKEISDSTIRAVQEAQNKTGITHAMVHASYLINLGSDTAATVKHSLITLKKEIEQCNALGINYLVLHPGGGKSDPQKVMQQISAGLTEVLQGVPHNKTMILLEIMAGQGSHVGSTFEELAYLRSNVHEKKNIGFCIDTCHLWAAGYDFSTEKGYKKVFEEFDTILGISHLKAIHLNDSKQKLGSHVDRHAEIGEGTIGLEAFRLLMNDKQLYSIPKVLETPKDELEDYARNMHLLYSLVSDN